jgi:excisionase family DNA binding protein
MFGDARGMRRDNNSEPAIIELVSVSEARRQLGGISSRTLTRLAADGRIRTVLLGRRRLYRRSDLNRIARGE